MDCLTDAGFTASGEDDHIMEAPGVIRVSVVGGNIELDGIVGDDVVDKTCVDLKQDGTDGRGGHGRQVDEVPFGFVGGSSEVGAAEV